MPPADEQFRAPVLWLLAPYIGGLIIASAGAGLAGPMPIGIALLLAGSAIAISFGRGRRAHVAWAMLLALAAGTGGVVRMQQVLDPAATQARWQGMPAREAALEVKLTRLFAPGHDLRGQPRQLCIGEIANAPAPLDDLPGRRVCFALAGADATGPDLVRTAHLQVRGILRRIDRSTITAGGFDEFLLKSGVGFVLDRAELVEMMEPAGRLASFLHQTNQRFEKILRHDLPEGHPATGVYVAMFLGRKSELSETQKENFLRSGTMHLFAISGLHIMVVAMCLQRLLVVVRVPPRVATLIGLAALLIFVETTGGTPSARRALLMVAFIWAGTTLRRPFNPLASLTTSAMVVLALDPLALLNASFQFSYSVVASLLLYGVPLRNRWHAFWHPWRDLPTADWNLVQWGIFKSVRGALSIAAISCAATLISTPLTIAYFGLASPGAVLSNLVLMPVTIGAISAGLASLLCGLAGVWGLSTEFNHARALILAVVDVGAGWAAAVPGMFFLAGFKAGWMAPFILLVMLALMVAGYARGWNRLPGRCWTPPLVLVGLIVFLVTPGGDRGESAAMKSAYELAMERLKKSDPNAAPELSAEQKAKLAEVDRVYQGRIAEREIFLQQRLAEAKAGGQGEELEKIRQQIVAERARLEEEREDEKNKVRRAAAGGGSTP